MDALISTLTKQGFGGGDELVIEVLGKGSAWVVGENAGEHDGIVLGVAALVVLFAEKATDGIGGFAGSEGRGLGSIDDGGEVEVLVASVGGAGGA